MRAARLRLRRAVLDGPRVDRVHLHAVTLADVGERLGEGEAAGVDRAADGEIRTRRAPAHAHDGKERALARLEQRPGRAREADVGEELEGEAVLPIALGKREQIPALGGTGVVDENIEPAEALPHRVEEPLGLGGLPEIAGVQFLQSPHPVA